MIEDTRNFVRNSPGLAVAGAAIVGFMVARLIKSGLNRDEDDDGYGAEAADRTGSGSG